MKSDGLLGLSLNEIGDSRQDLFIDKLYEQGKIKEKIFTLYLSDIEK